MKQILSFLAALALTLQLGAQAQSVLPKDTPVRRFSIEARASQGLEFFSQAYGPHSEYMRTSFSLQGTYTFLLFGAGYDIIYVPGEENQGAVNVRFGASFTFSRLTVEAYASAEKTVKGPESLPLYTGAGTVLMFNIAGPLNVFLDVRGQYPIWMTRYEAARTRSGCAFVGLNLKF